MLKEKYLSIEPCVVPANQETKLTIRLIKDPSGASSGFEIQDDCLIYQGEPCYFQHVNLQFPSPHPLKDNRVAYKVNRKSNTLTINLFFSGEQEHHLCVRAPVQGQDCLLETLYVFSLKQDLLGCLPWKGDLHMHSDRSDGRDTPAHVAAACRRVGFDFMALTDHGQFRPSLEAIEAFADVPIDLMMYTGEEVHAPGNPVHIVHVGGRDSINEQFNSRDYIEAVRSKIELMPRLPLGVDPYAYASSLWIFEQIKAGGGLSIFCHPYWLNIYSENQQGYYISEPLTTILLDQQPYDALEVLGGYHLDEAESNNLQIARYHDERARGRKIPIVGVSDAHGCETGELFGWFYTLVFSRSPELTDIKQAILDCRSVAVEALPGEVIRVHGPFRLVRYALFLLRTYFPEHDRCCKEEGEAMLSYIGEVDGLDRQAAAKKIEQLQGQIAALQKQLFASR